MRCRQSEQVYYGLPHLEIEERLGSKSTQNVLRPNSAEWQHTLDTNRLGSLLLELIALRAVHLSTKQRTILVVITEGKFRVNGRRGSHNGSHAASEELHSQGTQTRFTLASKQGL